MKKGIYRKYIKRILDITISLIALIVFSPVMIVCAYLIKKNLGSPVLYKQKRPGLNEKIFEIYKFKTMLNSSGRKDETDEDRMTDFGVKLRSTSLDELPQLINILKGDMSIVGPRPLMPSYLPFYTEEEKLRHSVKPGLTGLAQTSGRNLLTWDEKLKKDVEYVNDITFLKDLSILINTVLKVIKKEGFSADINGVEGSLDEVRQNENLY